MRAGAVLDKVESEPAPTDLTPSQKTKSGDAEGRGAELASRSLPGFETVPALTT